LDWKASGKTCPGPEPPGCRRDNSPEETWPATGAGQIKPMVNPQRINHRSGKHLNVRYPFESP
jgi:hypothetical protein